MLGDSLSREPKAYDYSKITAKKIGCRICCCCCCMLIDFDFFSFWLAFLFKSYFKYAVCIS